MPNLCYFEIPVDDMSRVQGFYKETFGWTFEKGDNPDPQFDYWHIHTGSNEEFGIPMGGMMKRQAPEHKVTTYIHVKSVDAFAEKVQKNGGKIIMPKTPVPGKGHFAIFLDPEKNAFGLWECDESVAGQCAS